MYIHVHVHVHVHVLSHTVPCKKEQLAITCTLYIHVLEATNHKIFNGLLKFLSSLPHWQVAVSEESLQTMFPFQYPLHPLLRLLPQGWFIDGKSRIARYGEQRSIGILDKREINVFWRREQNMTLHTQFFFSIDQSRPHTATCRPHSCWVGTYMYMYNNFRQEWGMSTGLAPFYSTRWSG